MCTEGPESLICSWGKSGGEPWCLHSATLSRLQTLTPSWANDGTAHTCERCVGMGCESPGAGDPVLAELPFSWVSSQSPSSSYFSARLCSPVDQNFLLDSSFSFFINQPLFIEAVRDISACSSL